MNDEALDQGSTQTLEWLNTAIGNQALAYLLGCATVDIIHYALGESHPSIAQEEVIETLSHLYQNLRSELGEDAVNEAVCRWLLQVDQGQTIAARLHQHTFGEEVLPDTENQLESDLAGLALEVYVGFLFPPDPRLPWIVQSSGVYLSAALFGHPKWKTFKEVALEDPIFGSVFTERDELTGGTGLMYSNEGSGGSIQLFFVAESLLKRAWRRLAGERSPNAFARQVVDEFRLACELIAGKTRSIPAKIAFTGVLMPPGVQLALDCGVVRAAAESDYEQAPEPIKGKLSGTDADGSNVLINYDGDVILDYEYPYKVRFVKPPSDLPQQLSDDMRPAANFANAIVRLRFSLVLAVDRGSRAQLIQTWESVNAPLSSGPSMAWSDPRRGSGLIPIQLSDAEVNAWGEWYRRLSLPHVLKIELALSRVLRALAERRDPSDVLIDAVIAWENLFGTKEGEPTFRITTCLAILLAESVEDREELRKRFGRIYKLRSKIVHGSGNLKQDEYPLCQEALDVAISAIRVLTTDRADILQLPDGAGRSARLLLGG